jgi:hypothetical protein
LFRGFFIVTFVQRTEEIMPLPTFLFLIFAVILAAGLSITLVHLAGVSLVWLGFVALIAAWGVRGLKWL